MDVVIFGLERLSVLAAYALKHDSPHRPVAFTVHERFVSCSEVDGLPVRRFEDIERVYPPERFALLAPLGWRRMGDLRAQVVREGRTKGYSFVSYVSSRALTWPDFQAGENCLVYDGTIVQPFTQIGDNCAIRSGAMLSHDVLIGDHCFVAARAAVGGRVRIGPNCVIGMNATICSGVQIASRCFIAAGAVVTADTEPGGIYRGNPARRSRVPVHRIERVGG